MAPLTPMPDWLTQPRGPCETSDSAGGAGRSRRSRGFLEKNLEGVASFFKSLFETEEFASRPGLLQAIDARARLLGLLFMVVGAALATTGAYLAALIVVSVFLALASRLPLIALARRTLPAFIFTALVALPVTTSLVSPGTGIFGLYGITITGEGVERGLFFLARVTAMASLVSLLALSTRQTDLFRGLLHLPIPAFFVTALYMTFRYALILVRIVEDATLARRSRTVGGASRASARDLRTWFATRASLILKKSLATADAVALAMASRGFTGRLRTFEVKPMRAADLLFIAASSFVFFLSFGLLGR